MSITIDDVAGNDRLDSRDLIEYAETLRADVVGGEELSEDDVAALAAIDDLEASGIEDWEHGAHFIRKDCFEDYARELADDIGAIPNDAQWPCTCIDWERAARELAMDYTLVTFLGHDYYVR